ncbi:MAG: serine protease, partial [Alphaproteobacteria bacterium]|nr:serine protease [Alphaproteobacteria bacterium]
PTRDGNGIVIDDSGLVLTIGYLVIEAMAVTVRDVADRPVSAEVIGYDHDTGFGLVRAERPLGVRPLRFGDPKTVAAGDSVLVIGHGGEGGAIPAYVMSKRHFAGYWEYMLDEAIFTAPPHPNWGGTALVDKDGKLIGVGSLFVQDSVRGAVAVPGNMFVPIDLLRPIFADLLANGRRSGPQRPWLGVLSNDQLGAVVITRVTPESPAAKAGLKPGDIVAGVGDKAVSSVMDFYRALWAMGDAGTSIPLAVVRRDGPVSVEVKSGNRYDYLQKKRSF